MNNTLEPVRLKCRIPILLIALLGLGAVLLGHLLQIPSFFTGGISVSLLTLINLFRALFYVILYTAVFVPFLLYVFSTHKKGKGPLYMTLTLVGLLLIPLSVAFWTIVNPLLYGYSFFTGGNLLTIVMYLVEAVCFGTPLLVIVLKLRNKILPIIALGFGAFLFTLTLFGSVLNLLMNADFYFDFEYAYAFGNLCSLLSGIDRQLGVILLLVATIFLIVTNDIFAKPQPKPIDPADALRELQAQLDAGTITEEDYQTQRAEIIANL